MHNNYFFIRQLSKALEAPLNKALLVECFSQNKDELILIFQKKDRNVFYIQAHLNNDFSILHFPQEFRRARKNTISLFEELNNAEVTSIEQAENERAFTIIFNSGYELIFKLFGNHANLILSHQGKVLKLFKSSLSLDWQLNRPTLHRVQDTSFANFQSQNFDITKTYFTLGTHAKAYLSELGYDNLSNEDKHQAIVETLIYLEHPKYYITRVGKKVVLSLFKIGAIIESYQEPLEAINAYYHAHYRYNFLEKNKLEVLTKIDAKIKSQENYISKCRTKINDFAQETPYEEIANIIMANLHTIPQGVTSIKLFDFYRNTDIEIKLKQNTTPQKYAESLYRKSKNKHLEIERLQEQIISKQSSLYQLQNHRSDILKVNNYKALEPFIKTYIHAPEQEREDEVLQFKTFTHLGFDIFVGRNSTNNDELTQRFAHKNDLWLHAKDVSGSHVVIRHQAGKPFPKPVIERAASLAAYYSKRKNDTLCPVIYTEKKYVRKVKGAPAGAVRVERENIIMVVPKE